MLNERIFGQALVFKLAFLVKIVRQRLFYHAGKLIFYRLPIKNPFPHPVQPAHLHYRIGTRNHHPERSEISIRTRAAPEESTLRFTVVRGICFCRNSVVLRMKESANSHLPPGIHIAAHDKFRNAAGLSFPKELHFSASFFLVHRKARNGCSSFRYLHDGGDDSVCHGEHTLIDRRIHITAKATSACIAPSPIVRI